MSDFPNDPTGFMEQLNEQWSEYARQTGGMWQDAHRRMATSYREFIDQQLTEEGPGKEWVDRVTQLMNDSIESQREARTRFLESQRSMIDAYLDKLGQQTEASGPAAEPPEDGEIVVEEAAEPTYG